MCTHAQLVRSHINGELRPVRTHTPLCARTSREGESVGGASTPCASEQTLWISVSVRTHTPLCARTLLKSPGPAHAHTFVGPYTPYFSNFTCFQLFYLPNKVVSLSNTILGLSGLVLEFKILGKNLMALDDIIRKT